VLANRCLDERSDHGRELVQPNKPLLIGGQMRKGIAVFRGSVKLHASTKTKLEDDLLHISSQSELSQPMIRVYVEIVI